MEKEFEPEHELIGSLLIKPENFESVSSQLSEEDFFSPQCRNIFLAIKELYQDGIPVDITTIVSKLRKEEDRKLSRYLEGETPTAETLPYWVRRVKEDSIRRQIMSEVNKGDEMNGEKIEALAYQLNGLKHPAPTCQFFEDIPSINEDSFPTIKTGFKALDRHFPFRAPRMIIAAGQTGQGKTSLLLQIAYHISQERTVGVISIERTAQEIQYRIINSFGRAPPVKRFMVEAPGAISTLKMKHILKTMKNRGADVVMVDFLQLMKETDRFATRHLEVSHIVRCLKDFNKEFKIPMIVISTVSRGSEGARPTLNLLKESGDLEFAADLVLFIHQPKKGDDDYKGENVKLFILAKNLWGPCGDIPVIWEPSKTRFKDYREEAVSESQFQKDSYEVYHDGQLTY